jgi:ADP-heptose:LPS heptosyltransferase
MDLLKVINKHRRRLTQRITKNIGKSNSNKTFDLQDLPEIKRVLICRPNHRLGNLLLITPIVQEIRTQFPDCKIDLFVKGGLAPIIFKNYKNIDSYIILPKKPFKYLFRYIRTWFKIRKKNYDLTFNVVSKSSSGKLAAKLSKSTFKCFGDEFEDQNASNKNFNHIAKIPVSNFRKFIESVGYNNQDGNIPGLNIKLDFNELEAGKFALAKIASDKKKTICIFTFATGNKCYSKRWWNTFYENLKNQYKNYNIVEILPVENVSQIEFKAPSYYSRDVREIAAFIANTSIFIGADSGIMHLASSSLTPTMGLFSVTDENMYHPYNNSSLAINTNKNFNLNCFTELDKILNPY